MRNKYVEGVGINDANYAVFSGRVGLLCPYYNVWREMLKRCYSSRFQKYQPTYNGCTVCEEWHLFSNFKSWMETQDWEGKCLDKDLLVYKNKVYSPETCVFVLKNINNFLNKHQATRGSYPLGVYYKKPPKHMTAELSKPFIAQISYKAKFYHVGNFSDITEAHRAWQKAKIGATFDLALEQTDERVKQGLMRVYEKILSDYEQGLETKDF